MPPPHIAVSRLLVSSTPARKRHRWPHLRNRGRTTWFERCAKLQRRRCRKASDLEVADGPPYRPEVMAKPVAVCSAQGFELQGQVEEHPAISTSFSTFLPSLPTRPGRKNGKRVSNTSLFRGEAQDPPSLISISDHRSMESRRNTASQAAQLECAVDQLPGRTPNAIKDKSN